MADFDAAVQITLQHEGGFFHNPVTGEVVNHGITLTFVKDSGYNPAADEAFIQNLSAQQATEIYRRYFWDRYNIGAINGQDLAAKAFDLTVNMGPAALRLLQQAVNDCGGHLNVDGNLGPLSIAAINALDSARLLAAFREHAKDRYQQIAAGNANLAGNLDGWLARLNA
ncbi:MAG TPA: glycosyl hydrolase 108 family protein [Bryobacteraceae bacterium]|nr:glycosyl hydrolase 108 family protein [Bryobacteraceae bacterium]